MNEYQEVVDELRFILQREVIEQNDALTDLVARYSKYCHDVNVRLRRCEECLKQGLRSEALHLAEANPNLSDAVAVLDFSEREQLIEVVELYFLAAPEPLLLEVAASLNRAYAEHEPLEKMLELHRLLALGRAPLNQRLAVLRSLSDLDPGSLHWETDVREMEMARFREFDFESLAAAKSGNTSVLKSIVDEIQAPGWKETVPSSLAREVKARATATVRSVARQRIVELNDELHSAFSSLDVPKARQVREAWKQNRQQANLKDNDPLVDQVAPILDWLSDEDRKLADANEFAKCRSEIESAIDDDNVSADELKRLKLTAERYDRSLPQMLETRFRSRLATQELKERRKKKRLFAVLWTAATVVLALIAFAVHTSVETRKTHRRIALASQMLDEGRLNEAQQIVDQHALDPTSQTWSTVKTRLAEAQQSEKDRIANLSLQVAKARESADLNVMELALKKARELAKTTEEKIELGQVEAAWQKRSSEAMAERERIFREQIDAAKVGLKNLDSTIGSSETIDPSGIRSCQNEIEKSLALLLPEKSLVSKELASQVSVIESRYKASLKIAEDLIKKADLLDRLSDVVLMLPENSQAGFQAEQYGIIVTEFVESLPNDPQVEAMKLAAECNPFPAKLAQLKLLKRWRNLKPVSKNDAKSRLVEVRTFLTDYPQSPDNEMLGEYEAWLASIVRRFEEDGDPDEGIQRRFIGLLNSKFIKEAQVLQDKSGNAYYLQDAPVLGSISKFKHFVGFNGETNLASLTNDKLQTTAPIPAPHQEITSKARTMLRSEKIDDWRDNLRGLAEGLLKADTIDPFLRYLLLLKTVEFAGRGDSILEQQLTGLLQKLNDEEIDRSVPWMDPNSQSAAIARRRAAEIVAAIPLDSIAPLFDAADQRQSQFEHAIFAPRFSVGLLERNTQGRWKCRSKWSPEGEYLLHAVSRPDASGVRKWLEVGSIKNRQFLLNPAAAQESGEASVVFASLASTETKTARTP